ncbi:hypothetical protein PPL_08614 [Heterostelium album PN500]|uniref:Uncharacterized protein n=1 Tax=Heterostelium pallidum (strain ATCC 26659 / Pp 5 / PN500) TaxID=670386 RepID=D3BJ89_HETP5|nr:hypothetical protein PPL_08614 [Heterostelium album PN500]EFA77969.1 hypothetical protein PPL_08614 [Heterostelium album PN500]|eukprot:XP_020430097.1 hypothetical protein PPL_08614 [Heterostelium album PN500]
MFILVISIVILTAIIVYSKNNSKKRNPKNRNNNNKITKKTSPKRKEASVEQYELRRGKQILSLLEDMKPETVPYSELSEPMKKERFLKIRALIDIFLYAIGSNYEEFNEALHIKMAEDDFNKKYKKNK